MCNIWFHRFGSLYTSYVDIQTTDSYTCMCVCVCIYTDGHKFGNCYGWLVGLINPVQREVPSKEVVAGTEIPGGGGRGRLYLTLHCHHHNDSCIKVGIHESHLNVSLTVKSRRHCNMESGIPFSFSCLPGACPTC